ncbi:MAG: hypothetical protein MUF51_07880 [Vicinamibacteria bacterium]|nr:hypothetical protein [Vicinamibacteria bacterium]
MAGEWQPVGPAGGDVRALAYDARDPRVVYLGTADGVLYRSADAGLAWQRLTPGFPLRGQSLDDIVVTASGAIYVGYWTVRGSGGGVARSLDGGRTFAILPGIEGQAVRCLAVAPSDASYIVVGTTDGVWNSRDGGATWRRISPEGHADIHHLDSLAIDPADARVIYAGTWHLAWKTMDGGQTWRPVHTGMIDDSDVMTLSIDRRTARSIYATACSGIYRSRDGAARWSKIPGIPSSSRRTRAFSQDPRRPATFYAGTTEGLWISDDDLRSFRLATARSLVVNSIAALPGGPLLLGCDGVGVLRSTDGGRLWTQSNPGFHERSVVRVAFDRASARILVGMMGDRSYGGVQAASGYQGPWSKLGAGLEGREVLALHVFGPEALVGTDDGLYFWQPATPSWQRLQTMAAGIDLHPRVIDVLALTRKTLLAATDKGLLRSTDGGLSWQRQLLSANPMALALLESAQDPGLVFVATPLGFYRSQDAGANWSYVSSIPTAGLVHRLAFLPGDENVLFAATTKGLFKSQDQGRTWRERGGGLPISDIAGLALSGDGRTLYAGDYGHGGLYRSDDVGETWRALDTAGLRSPHIFMVSLDPGGALLAAAPTGGLYRFVEESGAAGMAASAAP